MHSGMQRNTRQQPRLKESAGACRSSQPLNCPSRLLVERANQENSPAPPPAAEQKRDKPKQKKSRGSQPLAASWRWQRRTPLPFVERNGPFYLVDKAKRFLLRTAPPAKLSQALLRQRRQGVLSCSHARRGRESHTPLLRILHHPTALSRKASPRVGLG